MASLFVLEVTDFAPLWENARSDEGVTINHRWPYVEISFQHELTIDRKATGLRHAVWYSGIGGIAGAKVAQYDKTMLKLVAEDGANG